MHSQIQDRASKISSCFCLDKNWEYFKKFYESVETFVNRFSKACTYFLTSQLAVKERSSRVFLTSVRHISKGALNSIH